MPGRAARDVPRPPPPLDAVLATVGHAPGEYTNKVDVELSATMPARMALAAVLLRLLDTLEANVAGTIRDIDTEFLHDLRVAVRRTRTALKLGADLLPDGLAAEYQPAFKWLGDLTTPTRDLDVHLLTFAAGAAELTSASPAELEPFHAYLAERRTAEQHQLARALRSARFTTLPPPGAAPSPASRPRGGARTRHMPPRGSSAARTGASSSVAARSVPALPRSGSTTCASGARNCGTPWNSSRPCTTRPRTGRRCES